MGTQYTVGAKIIINYDQSEIKSTIQRLNNFVKANPITIDKIKIDSGALNNIKSNLEKLSIKLDNVSINNVKLPSTTTNAIKSKIESISFKLGNLKLDTSKIDGKKVNLTLYVPSSEITKLKEQIEGLRPIIRVQVQGVNQVPTPGSSSLTEAKSFIDSLTTSGSYAGNTVINYELDQSGKLIAVLKNAQNETIRLKYQFDEASKSFQQIGSSTRVPELLNQSTAAAQRTFADLRNISNQFNVLKQQAGSNPIDFKTQQLIPDLELLNTKLRTLSNGMQQVTQVYKLNETQTVSVSGNYNMLRGQMDSLSTSTGNLMNRQIGLSESFSVAISRFPVWIVASTLVMGAIHKMSEAFSFMSEQSKLFTNLQLEMTNTNLVFSDITNTANEFATAMGSTTDKVMKAISVFGTYTSTIEDVLTKSQSSITLSNITGQGVEQTSDELMGILTQYQLTAKDINSVTDSVLGASRNLQMDFPKAVSEVSSGLRTVGSVAKEAGLNVAETTGILSKMIEVTRRSGSENANALRTIISRISNVGEESDPEQFKGIEKQFNAIGIAIKSSSDTIRPLGEILSDLGEKWKNLNDVERQSIAQASAGMYRRNAFISLMSNYDEVLKNVTAAETSEGVTEQKQEIYSKSLTASVERLTAAWEKFYLNAINNNTWKSLVEGLTFAINGFANFANVVGGIPAVLTTVVLAGTVFSTKFRTFTASLLNFNTILKALGITARVTGLALSASLTVATFGLSLVLSLTIGKLIEFADSMIHAKEKQQEYINELTKSISTLKQETAEASGLAEQYEKLSGQTNLTTEEKSKLVDVQQRLASLFPDLVTGYDAEGNAILGTSEAIQQAIKDNEELLKSKQQLMADQFKVDAPSDFSQFQKDQEKLNNLMRDRQSALKDIADIESGKTNRFDEYNNDRLNIAKGQLKGINDELKTLQPNVLQEKKDISGLADAFLQSGEAAKALGKDSVTKLIYGLSNLQNESKITGEQFYNIFNGLKDSDFTSKINEAKNHLTSLSRNTTDATVIQNAYDKAISDLIPYLVSLGISGENASKILKDMLNIPDVAKAKDQVHDLTTSLSELQKTLASSSSTISDVNSALQEYNDTGSFNLDTIIKLAEKYPVLLTHLNDEKALRQDLTDIINQEQEASRQAYAQMLMDDQNFYSQKVLNNSEAMSALSKLYNGDLTQYKSLAEAKSKVDAELIQHLASMWANYYKAGKLVAQPLDGGRTVVDASGKEQYITPEMKAQYAGLKQYSDQMSAMADAMDAIALKGTSGVDFSGIGMSGKDPGNKKSPSTPLSEFVSIEDSLVKSYNTEADITKEADKLLVKQIANAKSAKDFNTELSKTKDLIAGQTKEISQLGEARSKIQTEFSRVSSASGFQNTSTWFDPSGDDTLAYQQAYKDSSVEVRKAMKETHDELQILMKAYYANGTAIDTLVQSNETLKTSLTQISIDKFNQSISDIDTSISQLKADQDLYNSSSEQYIKDQQQIIELQKQKGNLIDAESNRVKTALSSGTLNPESTQLDKTHLSSLTLASSQNQKDQSDAYLTNVKTIYETQQKQNDALQKSLDLQLQLTDAVSPKNYDQISVILGSQISLQQTNTSKIQESIASLTTYRNTLDQSSEKWKEVNDEISTMNTNLESSLSTLAQTYKSQEQNSMNQQLNSIEKTIFNGQTESEASQALKNRTDYNNEYISGTEKAAAVLRILNQVQQDNASLNNGIVDSQHQQITLTQSQLDLLNSSSDIKRSDLDLLEKQLAIQKTQAELAKEQNQKTIQQLTYDDSSGKWNYTYVTDQSKMLQLQGTLYQEQQDLAKTQKDDELKDQQTLLNQKSTYYNNLKTVVQNALNGEYTTTTQFNNALLTANSSFLNSMQGSNSTIWTSINSVVTTNISSMLSSYTNYVNEMAALQARLAAIMGASARLPSSVGNTSSNSNSSSSSSSVGQIVGTSTGPNGSHLTTITTATGTQTVLSGTNGTPAWANGTEDAPEGFSITSEKGAELTYLNKGSAVIPANFTKNIMAFGANPLNFMQNLIGGINLPQQIPSFVRNTQSGSNQQVFNIDNISFPNILDSSGLEEAFNNLPLLAAQRAKVQYGQG